MSQAAALPPDLLVPAINGLDLTVATSTVNWAALDPDILGLILNHLEVADSARFAAVCRSWRSSAASSRRRRHRHRPQIPWLMLSTPMDPSSRFFYSLSERRTYKIHLPQIACSSSVGSSEGFLVSVDFDGELHVTNPLTGAHRSLPPRSTLPYPLPPRPDGQKATHFLTAFPLTGAPVMVTLPFYMRSFYFHKAILFPSSDGTTFSVFIIYQGHAKIAFSRPGDASWTVIDAPVEYFNDFIFHKGKLHAVNYMGTVAVFDPDRPLDPPFVFPPGPLYRKSGGSRRYLVESPDGRDLFMVYRDISREDEGEEAIFIRTTDFTVFKLDGRTHSWGQVRDLGDLALFLGFNQSLSLSATRFPDIRRNCIYFSNDYKEFYNFFRETANYMGVDMGVFDLADGSVQHIELANVDLKQFVWPPAVWFTPVL